jgi:hypothetical protein
MTEVPKAIFYELEIEKVQIFNEFIKQKMGSGLSWR